MEGANHVEYQIRYGWETGGHSSIHGRRSEGESGTIDGLRSMQSLSSACVWETEAIAAFMDTEAKESQPGMMG